MPQRRLKRQLTLAQIVMLGTAGTIGAQIFVLTGYAAELAGPAAVLALLAGGLLSHSIALNYCELATTFPVTGGAMTYVREAWGNNLLSFLVGSLDCLSSTFFSALSAVGFAYSLQVLIPALPIVPVAVAVIAGFTVLNLLGATQVGQVQILLGGTLLLIFVVYILLGLSLPGGFRWATFLADGRFFPHAGPAENALGVLRAIALTYVAYIGFEVIADDAEEVREPNRNIPRGILISLTLVIVINVLTALVTLGSVPWTELAGSETALTDAVARILPGWGAPLMALAGLVATLTTINTSMLSATREAFTLSRDGAWPRALSRLSRFRTPYLAILLIGVVSGVITAIGLVDFLSYISSAGYLFVLFWASLAMVRLRKIHPDATRPFTAPGFPLTPYLAAGMCFLILAFTDGRALAFGAGLLVAGSAFYYLYRPATRILASRIQASERSRDRLLVPVANPRTAERLVRLAATLAQASEDTNVCVLTVTRTPRRLPPDGLRPLVELWRSRQATAFQAITQYAQARAVPLYIKVRAAPEVARGILDELKSHGDVKLILLGWPGSLSGEALAGNVVKEVLATAPTNVAVLLDRGLATLRRILVPVGGGPHSRLAIRLAVELADAGGAQVTVLHTLPESLEAAALEDEMLQLRDVIADELGDVPEGLITRLARAGSVPDGILAEAEHGAYDLLVIGASEEWISRTQLFGAVDDWIADRAPCSVLLVRRHEPVAIAWLRRQVRRLGRENHNHAGHASPGG